MKKYHPTKQKSNNYKNVRMILKFFVKAAKKKRWIEFNNKLKNIFKNGVTT